MVEPESGLNKVLKALSNDQMSREELRSWIGKNIWDLLDSPGAADREAVMELDLALGAVDDGHEPPEHLSFVASSLLRQGYALTTSVGYGYTAGSISAVLEVQVSSQARAETRQIELVLAVS
jgi:hypothetical protein